MHHGKTALMDTLVMSTHPDLRVKKNGNLPKYTDTRKDEQGKEISLKASPMSLVLPDSNDKSYLINIMDTPGHANFRDEVIASLRIADGVALVVDCTLGMTACVERLLPAILLQKLPMV
jgi:U5 small nuclear ribonucleoprotein component